MTRSMVRFREWAFLDVFLLQDKLLPPVRMQTILSVSFVNKLGGLNFTVVVNLSIAIVLESVRCVKPKE
jgi:hypothetical protein